MNIPDFLLPILTGGIIQLLKIMLDFFREGKINIASMFRAGGFPSVHSGISTSIATIMLLKYGYESAEFALAIIFAFLFWYDAMNIRYEAGKHAKYINKISIELKTLLNFTENYFYLKERLGHTFIEVIGGIVIGCLITVILHFYFQL